MWISVNSFEFYSFLIISFTDELGNNSGHTDFIVSVNIFAWLLASSGRLDSGQSRMCFTFGPNFDIARRYSSLSITCFGTEW